MQGKIHNFEFIHDSLTAENMNRGKYIIENSPKCECVSAKDY